MWCPHCQSDVPQAAGSAIGSRTCGRCARTVLIAHDVHTAHGPAGRTGSDDGLDLETAPVSHAAPRVRAIWDDWTLASEVQRAQLMLSGAGGHSAAAAWRLDDLHLLTRDVADAGQRPPRRSVSYRGVKLRKSWRAASLAALALGVAAFLYGVAMAASLVDVSGTVSRLGVPLMLVGLFGLVLGLLIQVLTLRRESSAAIDRMRLVELRLQEYRQAALLVSPVSHVAASHSRAIFH